MADDKAYLNGQLVMDSKQDLVDEIKRLTKALEDIALLDEADGHELTADHAMHAVGIASSTLGKHPSVIFSERNAKQPTRGR